MAASCEFINRPASSLKCLNSAIPNLPNNVLAPAQYFLFGAWTNILFVP